MSDQNTRNMSNPQRHQSQQGGNKPRFQDGGRGFQSGQNGEKQEVHAPFNFVPLADMVLVPDWGRQVSQDIPVAEGVSGILEFELTAHTPLLIGAQKRADGVNFFQLPDRRYAIPGSSLRGMVRNVLEIATFSHMRVVQDQRFSVRNLQNAELYGDYLTGGDKPKRIFKPKSKSGWLRFEQGKWHLYSCNHARVEQQLIEEKFNLTKESLGQRQNSGKKYSSIRGSVVTKFTAEEEKTHPHSSGKKLIYSKVTSLTVGEEGYIVLTGQASPIRGRDGDRKYGTKHMEFIFGNRGAEVNMRDHVLRDFIFIHSDTEEWKFLKLNNPFPKECGIPVFYLLDEQNEVSAMGLAQMFKLAYKNSVHDMIRHSDGQFGDKEPDFVETLFGRVSNNLEETLKGRVSFGYAVCEDREVKPVRQQAVVLNSPKPSYYPSYVRQKSTTVTSYKTYMDSDATISGWKRYPVREYAQPEPAAIGTEKIQSILNPLPQGSTFVGKLRFHNLHPEELGALAWAMTWGGNRKLFHTLGMGKPFGFGRISIDLKGESTSIIPNRMDHSAQTLSDYIQIFERYMNSQFTKLCEKTASVQSVQMRDEASTSDVPVREAATWMNSQQMQQLLAMADPVQAKGRKLKYMMLGKPNQFVEAQKAKSALGLYKPI